MTEHMVNVLKCTKLPEGLQTEMTVRVIPAETTLRGKWKRGEEMEIRRK